jgi:spoIIIJ-associated protein
MKKIEASTLEEAYDIACREFDCSITELRYEIVQYPSGGIFGLFGKKAIIVADAPERVENIDEEKSRQEVSDEGLQSIDEGDSEAESHDEEPKEPKSDKEYVAREGHRDMGESDRVVMQSFFCDKSDKDFSSKISKTDRDVSEVAQEIEAELRRLIDSACFDIDTVEVDVENGTAYIFIDGEDAALLIGREGYRYNALSYLLFNWIHARYGLYIKLEIAQFLSSQQEMISNYIKPVIEHVESEGWGRTRPLDGILVQIALEQLRERFPDKYVAIKKSRSDGKRYVVINDFLNSPRE